MKQKSNRGGKRCGAGRKSGEPTKVIRVPVGCLKHVTEIIEAYKANPVSMLFESGNINQIPIDLNHETEIKSMEDSRFNPDSKQVAANRRALEKLDREARRELECEYGSLQFLSKLLSHVEVSKYGHAALFFTDGSSFSVCERYGIQH